MNATPCTHVIQVSRNCVLGTPVSRRRTTLRWGLAIAAAFGVGATVAWMEERARNDVPASPVQVASSNETTADHVRPATTTRATTTPATAAPETPERATPPPAAMPASAAPAVPPAARPTARVTPAPDARSAPRRGRRPRPMGVTWSTDLAASYATAREKNQLVLLFVGAYGET